MDSLVEKRCVVVETLFCEKTAFWNEDLGKAEWVRREMRSSALRWLRLKAIEETQRKSCSRWGKEAGSRREGEERDGWGIALLPTLMVSSVKRQRALRSWW